MKNFDWLWMRPIAHRGLYDAERPENSLAAFHNAVSHGVPFELDVQLASDGMLVVAHDANLLRVTGESVNVSGLDRDQLRRLRIGSPGERIPVLYEVLEAVDGHVPVMLDIRRWRPTLSADLERAVAAETRGYSGLLAIQSFDPLAVARLHRLIEDYPIGQVSGRLESAGQFAAAVGRTMATNIFSRPDFISYELSALPSPYASFWRKYQNLPLIAWTVSEIAEEERASILADNFIFDSYIPSVYQQECS